MLLDVPGSTIMTANTIVDNIALGAYSTEETEPDIQTYTATVAAVPEPPSTPCWPPRPV